MIIITTLITTILIGVLLAFFKDSELSGAIAVLFSIILLFFLIFLPTQHITINSEIATFKSVIVSIDVARRASTKAHFLASTEDIGGLSELAGLQLSIIESNKWLAEVKYYNNSLLDIWIPDEVELLEPIK